MTPVNISWLLFVFIHRDLKDRYTGSKNALIWVFIHPLILLAVYFFLFQIIFKVKLPDLYQSNFIVFIALVLWPWLMFQESITRSATKLTENQALIHKSCFDRNLLIYASVIASFLIHSSGYLIILSTLLFTQQLQFHGLGILLTLLILVVLFIFALGNALLFSALQVFIRDTEYALSPLLMIVFYLTPILYTLNIVPQKFQILLYLNPLTTLFESIRFAMTGQYQNLSLTLAFVSVFILLFSGACLWFFNRLAPHFEDYL